MNTKDNDTNLNNDALKEKLDKYINKIKTNRPKVFPDEPEGVINSVLDHKGGKNEK